MICIDMDPKREVLIIRAPDREKPVYTAEYTVAEALQLAREISTSAHVLFEAYIVRAHALIPQKVMESKNLKAEGA